MAIKGQNSSSKGQNISPKIKLFGRKNKSDEPLKNRGTEDIKFSSMLDFLPYKGFTQDSDHFLILSDEDDGYAELLNIQGQGISTMSLAQQELVLEGFQNFLRTALDDMKVIISPFPADTSPQQTYHTKRYQKLMQEIRRVSDPRRQEQLRAQIRYTEDQRNTAIQVEKQLYNEEFILMIFSKSRKDLRNIRENFIRWGGKSLIFQPLSLEKKEATLYRINNLNTRI